MGFVGNSDDRIPRIDAVIFGYFVLDPGVVGFGRTHLRLRGPILWIAQFISPRPAVN